MFLCTPLLGASSSTSASQTVLEFESGIKVLVDVGWDVSFEPDQLSRLEHELPSISLILLTHATLDHLGAYAHCCKHFPLFAKIPVYATIPVIALGRILLQTLYNSNPLAASTLALSTSSLNGLSADDVRIVKNVQQSGPTSEEIIRYFTWIVPVRYSQPLQPSGSPFASPPEGLTVTAYNAGHSLGGAIWHLQCGLESVIHASDWNQGRENVLAGAAWLSATAAGGAEVIEQLHRPTALICSSHSADERSGLVSRAQRDKTLFAMLKPILADGGTALVPVRTGSRLLELAYLFEQAWRRAFDDQGGSDILKTADLVIVSKQGAVLLQQAQEMVEWMNESIVKEFEVGEAHEEYGDSGPRQQRSRPKPSSPLEFRHLRIVKASLERFMGRSRTMPPPKGGRLILTDESSPNLGCEGEAMKELLQDSRNLVLMTEPSPRERDDAKDGDAPESSQSTLWGWYQDWKATSRQPPEACYQPESKGGREAHFLASKFEPLTTSESQSYRHYQHLQARSKAGLQTDGEQTLLTTADIVEGEDSSDESSDEDSDSEGQGKLLNLASTLGKASRTKAVLTDEELGVNVLLKKANTYDWDMEGRKGKDRMFPITVKRKRFDEYGDFIKAEDYLRADEREDLLSGKPAGETKLSNQEQSTKPSSKRKWDEEDEDKHRTKRPYRESDARSRNGAARSRDAETPQNGLIVSSISSSEDEEPSPSGPRKRVKETQTVAVRAKIGYIDFLGLRDMQSYRILLPLIAPRKLILLGGTSEQTQALARESRLIMGGSRMNGHGDSTGTSNKSFEVLTPGEGDSVNASVDTEAWEAVISQELYSQLTWQKVKNLKVVHLAASLMVPETSLASAAVEAAESSDEPNSKRVKSEVKAEDTDHGDGHVPDDAGEDSQSTSPHRLQANANDDRQQQRPRLMPLTNLPIHPSSSSPSPSSLISQLTNRTLHIGDIRLPDLRRVFQACGHAADFRGEGVMVIDQAVTLRKSGTGTLEVEGGGLLDSAALARAAAMGAGAAGAQASFVEVREKIYQGLAVISGA